ncbi:hypothetical protein BT93_E1708 [Corymbia citriodora subsp. variegata]|nr:hypothetical protein BT93_E1708 [Corymbia citriodora subsp. variegata]
MDVVGSKTATRKQESTYIERESSHVRVRSVRQSITWPSLLRRQPRQPAAELHVTCCCSCRHETVTYRCASLLMTKP